MLLLCSLSVQVQRPTACASHVRLHLPEHASTLVDWLPAVVVPTSAHTVQAVPTAAPLDQVPTGQALQAAPPKPARHSARAAVRQQRQ